MTRGSWFNSPPSPATLRLRLRHFPSSVHPSSTHEAKHAPHLDVGGLGWGRGRAGGTALVRSRMGDWQNQKSQLETLGLGWLVFQKS